MMFDLKVLDILKKIMKNLDCSIPEPQISYDPNLGSNLCTIDVFQEVKESVENMHNETIEDFDGRRIEKIVDVGGTESCLHFDGAA